MMYHCTIQPNSDIFRSFCFTLFCRFWLHCQSCSSYLVKDFQSNSNNGVDYDVIDYLKYSATSRATFCSSNLFSAFKL
ncbi:Bgt-20583 [Blumeria graminis f. sp. tritici]|uniref:Bgt-20583 n=1 Tax=Blumeria graminis f. sp. tritici TaxID=62690 RepID=A0A9X9QCU9_BLUGR|nr:Bgt-20583 [Blumeria graminis f. sp. tritici]